MAPAGVRVGVDVEEDVDLPVKTLQDDGPRDVDQQVDEAVVVAHPQLAEVESAGDETRPVHAPLPVGFRAHDPRH